VPWAYETTKGHTCVDLRSWFTQIWRNPWKRDKQEGTVVDNRIFMYRMEIRKKEYP
jgi:hypothetical protein